MILTLLRASWISLSRDRVAQLMTFLLPIAFFTIFALVFGGSRDAGTSKVRVAVADLSGTTASRRLVRALEREKGLTVLTQARPRGAGKSAPAVALDSLRASQMVRDGEVPVALVLPAGIDTSIARFDGRGRHVLMLTDPSDPVGPEIVKGLLEKTAMTAMPDMLARRGMADFAQVSGGLTTKQQASLNEWLGALEVISTRDTAAGAAGGDSARGGFTGLLQTDVEKVLGEKKDNGMVSFYAAGIAVMFLMFSCSAASGVLLEEVESGTLDRVLSSSVGMTGLLAGKFTYLWLLGLMQITVMFLWAVGVFHLDLVHHLPGFAVMTAVTAACTAAFGLVLATACRTRAQLGGISTIVILCFNAVGGSMFPRFLMSAGMQKAGLATFNAWALDGYVKVFWRNAALRELLPQVGVLLGSALVFAVVARLLARRWESA